MAPPPPVPPPPSSASLRGRARERLAVVAAGLLLLGAGAPAPAPTPGEARPPVMLMTGLPLVWGEKGPFDPSSRPAAAYVELSESFGFEPVDVLDPASLERGKLLFLAQPQRLAPAELTALDAWIRRGGRALILTDPMLNWPSELPLGDIRRPPPVGLLAPLLRHWRVAMDAPAEPGEVAARWNGRRLVLDSPGRFRSAGPDCVVGREGWTAWCRLGRGRVRLVADADLLHDSLWAPRGPDRPTADNPAVVGEWLDALAGTPRRRPRLAEAGPSPGFGWILAALVAAAIATALLLRRRRMR